jgi:hypothetical protein
MARFCGQHNGRDMMIYDTFPYTPWCTCAGEATPMAFND